MATRELTLRRAELRLAKKEASHRATLDYIDRGLNIITPIITSPPAMFLGAMVATDLLGHYKDKQQEYSGPFGWLQEGLSDIWIGAETGTMKSAIMLAFIANAFGGPAGITRIISAVK